MDKDNEHDGYHGYRFAVDLTGRNLEYSIFYTEGKPTSLQAFTSKGQNTPFPPNATIMALDDECNGQTRALKDGRVDSVIFQINTNAEGKPIRLKQVAVTYLAQKVKTGEPETYVLDTASGRKLLALSFSLIPRTISKESIEAPAWAARNGTGGTAAPKATGKEEACLDRLTRLAGELRATATELTKVAETLTAQQGDVSKPAPREYFPPHH